MATENVHSSGFSEGIELVDENNARSGFDGLSEEIPYTCGADADKHFDEVGPRDAEERNSGFSSHSSRPLPARAATLVLTSSELGDALEVLVHPLLAIAGGGSDVRGSAAYKRELVRVFVRRALRQALDANEAPP